MSKPILLVNPIRAVPKWPVRRKPAEPVELIYLAGALKAAGCGVDIIDLQLGHGNVDDVRRRIALNHYPAIGVGIPEQPLLWSGLKIAHDLKNVNDSTQVFAFGLLAALNARWFLEIAPAIDFVVTGDFRVFAEEWVRPGAGSTRIRELVGIEHRRARNHPPGIASVDGSIPGRQDSTALEIPPADRRLTAAVIQGGGNPAAVASHGCSGDCSFCCVSSHYSSAWRPRPVAHVADELQALVRRFETTRLHLADSSLLSPTLPARTWAADLCRVLSEFQPPLQLKTSCRLADLDETSVVMLQRAGFGILKIGIETFCRESQIAYGKAVERDAAARRLDFILSRGMEASIGFITFDPYLSLDDLRANLDFLLRYQTCWGRHLLLSRLIAYRGTRIEQRLEQDGLALARSTEGTSWRFRDPEVARVHSRFAVLVREEILDLEFDLDARYHALAAQHSPEPAGADAAPLAQCESLLKQCWMELFHRALDQGHPRDRFAACRRDAEERLRGATRGQSAFRNKAVKLR